jgi:hypothetical protein
VFLSGIDGDAIIESLGEKIKAKQRLSEEEIQKLIVAPLAKSKRSKQESVEACIDIAKGIQDEETQRFVIASIIVATDKFADRDYSNNIRRWLNMTKVGQIIYEEQLDAVNEAVRKTHIETAVQMLLDNENVAKIMKYTGLPRADIEAIRETL